jgi:type I restriction enzyme S subunit
MNFHKLDEFMVKRGGSVDPSKHKDETFELLSIPAFDKGSPEIVDGEQIGSSKKQVQPRDVLLSKIVPHIRRCWIVPQKSELRQIASGEWIQFRSDDVAPEYLRLFLMSDRFHGQFMKTVKGVGGSLLRASPAQVAEIEIPLPPLEDQICIAHILGKVEALIAQRKQHLQQLDDLLKSVFLKMFGDPVRNEMGWDIQPCDKAVFNISSGTSYGGEDRSFENPEELGVLKISAVTKGTFDPAEFKVVNRVQITKSLRFVKRGDFLFSRANTVELVAACCVVPQDHERLFLPDKIWVLTFNQELVTPQFFNYLLKNQRYRDVVRNLASGGHDSMLNISMKKFMTLDIPCPPIELQKKFTLIVEKVVSLKASYQKSLVDIEALYSALNQQAFKGRLNLSLIEMLNGQHARICDENDKME